MTHTYSIAMIQSYDDDGGIGWVERARQSPSTAAGRHGGRHSKKMAVTWNREYAVTIKKTVRYFRVT